jgi:hypothetical protein
MEDAIPIAEQRLVFGGRILPDDAVLKDLNIKEGTIVNLARVAVKSETPAAVQQVPRPVQEDTLPGGMHPEQMERLMSNPAISSIMDNPQFMSTIMQADPRIQRLMESNPEMRRMLSDPGFLRQTAQMMRDPRAMREFQRNQDRALANIESIPGGFQALSSLYSQLEPLHGPREEGNPSTDDLNRQFAERLGVTHATTETPNTSALPNPWAAPSNTASNTVSNGARNQTSPFANPQMMASLQQMMSGLRNQPTGQDQTNTQSTHERFSSQLQRLHELGFTDDANNVRALVRVFCKLGLF